MFVVPVRTGGIVEAMEGLGWVVFLLTDLS